MEREDNTPEEGPPLPANGGDLERKEVVFTLRNRIEDQEVALKWKDTLSLAADIGTKFFSIKRFKFLRDLVNGYALARATGKTMLPSMVVTLV